MATYEDRLAELATRRESAAKKRAATHEKEFEDAVFPLLLGDENLIHVPVPDCELAGHIVARPATRVEMSRLKSVFAKDKDKPGATEERAKVSEQLAKSCIVYPPADRYEAIVEAHPLVPEAVSDAIIARAKAAAAAEGKR